jgi:hypothetical protein
MAEVGLRLVRFTTMRLGLGRVSQWIHVRDRIKSTTRRGSQQPWNGRRLGAYLDAVGDDSGIEWTDVLCTNRPRRKSDLVRDGLRGVRARRLLPPNPRLARRETALVLDALEQAVWTRTRDGVADLSGLIHHHDAGSQYTSIAFTERLAQAGIDPSVGSVGDAYDCETAACRSAA